MGKKKNSEYTKLPTAGVFLATMKTIGIFYLVTILALGANAVRADQPAAAASDDDKMRVLQTAVEQAYTNALDGKTRHWKAYEELLQTNLPQILQLAQVQPASDTSREVFIWVVMKVNIERGPAWTNRLQALQLLTQYQATNASLGPLCGYIGHYWDWRWREKSVTDFLETIAEKNPDRDVRGTAIFALGRMNVNKAEALAELEQWAKSPFYIHALSNVKIPDFTAWGSSKAAAEEAEQELHAVTAHYADCPDRRPRGVQAATLLGKEAEMELFELEHLSLGKTAPEIAANGLDGTPLTLSSTRGKVTVVSFWASWCGPCMQLVPVERALAIRMQGKPFAMMGVNGDARADDATRAVAHEQITWPSFWNGKDGPNGPISSAWNVSGWPTVYVLDATGTIRFKTEGYGNVTSNLLNGCVDELMREAGHLTAE